MPKVVDLSTTSEESLVSDHLYPKTEFWVLEVSWGKQVFLGKLNTRLFFIFLPDFQHAAYSLIRIFLMFKKLWEKEKNKYRGRILEFSAIQKAENEKKIKYNQTYLQMIFHVVLKSISISESILSPYACITALRCLKLRGKVVLKNHPCMQISLRRNFVFMLYRLQNCPPLTAPLI